MRLDRFDRRLSYVFLCATPFLFFIVGSVRALRIPGMYQAIGGVLALAICIAAWILGLRAIKGDLPERQRFALAGGLLIASFAVASLFFVGLGPPWEATDAENRMRYVVLLVMAILVMSGLVALREALSRGSECLYSTLGFAATLLAGPLYLVWSSFLLGAYVVKVRAGEVPAPFAALGDAMSILLFFAVALTYVATAAMAASLGRVRWLGRGAARAFVIVSLFALLCVVIRGLEFPDPAALSSPWYTVPGFVAGVPAIPFIMPFLLGVVLLRRAGDEQLAAAA